MYLVHIYVILINQLKYPDQVTIHKPKDGITFSMQPDQHNACLTIKDFHKEVLKKEYKQDFKTEISNAFNLIAENRIQQLIIDLRNNQGGDLEYGVYLLSYLLDEPFRILDQYYKVGADETNDELVKTNGEESGIHACKENRFKGKVYVLINGGSFSNSGIVASALKIHNRAIFIGSETAGNNKVLAGYTKELNLPATNIYVEIPTRQFMLYEKLPLSGHGTMPDHMITPTIEDIMANRDPVKEFTLRLINEK